MNTAHLLPIMTHNRYQVLQGREGQMLPHPTNVPTSNDFQLSRSDFVNATVDNKLTCLFDELCCVRNEQLVCNKGLAVLEKALSGMEHTLNQVIQITNKQTDFIKTLAYQSIDAEARSRRNNLIFRGISENAGENCFQIIRDFLANNLDIDSKHTYLARAHRLGRRDPMLQVQKRPIIVNFRDFGDTEWIMGNANMLRGTGMSVDFDFPKEIQEARSRLWPKYKQMKAQTPHARIKLAYPAKILKDGRFVHDELPEWSKFTGANRLTQIEKMDDRSSFGQSAYTDLTNTEGFKVSNAPSHAVQSTQPR